MSDEEENPVVSGLVALVAVAVVVGLLAGIAVLLGTRLIGISGDTDLASDEPAAGATMYLPDPQRTERAEDPAITLLPTDTETPEPRKGRTAPSPRATTSSAAPTDAALNLSASPLSAEAGESVMLSGTYVNGEGSVIDIWRKVDDGAWEEFNVDAYVSGGIFQVNVQNYQPGKVQWKVRDEASSIESDPVTVTYG